MRTTFFGPLAFGLLFAGTPALAEYYHSAPLVGGGVAIWNSASGAISLCYKFNTTNRCETIGTFTGIGANVRIVSAEAYSVFHIYDAVAGKLLRCEINIGRVSLTSSGWTCAQVSARLP